jgi:hypothetical protein
MSRRAMIIGGAKQCELADALKPFVDDVVLLDEPYDAMMQITDNPRDFGFCVIDNEVFDCYALAERFLRILTFAEVGVPVVEITSRTGESSGCLQLEPGPVIQMASNILSFAAEWFGPFPTAPHFGLPVAEFHQP